VRVDVRQALKKITLLLTALLFYSTPLFSQNPASVSVTATKASFIFGEPVKLTARVKDSFGNLLPQATVNWTIDPPAAATITADGTVTPRLLQTVVFRALSGNVQGEIGIQFLPKRIVVTPQRGTMIVGSTQSVRAEAMDLGDRPIPGTVFRWTMTNLLRFWDNNNRWPPSTGPVRCALSCKARCGSRQVSSTPITIRC
jgi:hypothetical protein